MCLLSLYQRQASIGVTRLAAISRRALSVSLWEASLTSGLHEPLVDLVPVDDVPPGGQVLRAAVLVLEVVGVLPHVVAHDGIVALGKGVVLVGRAHGGQLAVPGEHQPGPAAAEALDPG